MAQVRRRARPAPLFLPIPSVSAVSHHRGEARICRCATQRVVKWTCAEAAQSSPSTIRAPSATANARSAPSANSKRQPVRDPVAEALDLLAWKELSQHVARLARTEGGRVLLSGGADGHGLEIGHSRARSEELLEETREMFELAHVLAREIPLRGASEVSGFARDAAKGRVLDGRSLRAVASTLASARATRRMLENAHGEHGSFPRLMAHARAARTWPDVEQAIISAIDEFGDVSDAADPVLAATRAERRDTVAAVRDTLRAVMDRHAEAVQERTVTTRYDRFVILVKATRKSAFRGAVVHDVSATGGTAYIEPAEVRRLNDRMRALAAREKARIHKVLSDLSIIHVAPIADDIVALCAALAAIDAAGARAQMAAELGGVDVRFDDKQPLRLRGVRHPLLAWTAKNGSVNWKESVVPSDYIVPAGVRCVCITGPNTGGKTVALKTLGLAVLMAKAGLFVLAAPPATGGTDSVRIPYFDNVLVDIGDDQSLVQSLSTFSGHVERIKRILSATTRRALVLFDEIGSGTDPAEGAALGAAILRSLAVEKRAALTLATTHHGELKTLKYASDGTGELFENACVEFDDVAMKPTYRLLWGIPGRSNALAIAERLGLSRDIISDARALLVGGEGAGRVDFEKMIAGLERLRREADNDAQNAQEARTQAAKLQQDAEKRLKKLADAEQVLRSDQRAAVNAELAKAKRSIAGVIRDLQRSGGTAQAAASATDKLSRLQGNLRKDGVAGAVVEESMASTDVEIVAGDLVRVMRLGSGFSDVVEITSNGDLVIAVGRMRAKVKRKEVVEVQRKKVVQVQRRLKKVEPSKKTALVRTAANSVDVRGERVDAAEARVEQALARALPMGALWIVHGHGTGRLRAGLRSFLRGHELVASYREGEDAEGGTGVTVAILRD